MQTVYVLFSCDDDTNDVEVLEVFVNYDAALKGKDAAERADAQLCKQTGKIWTLNFYIEETLLNDSED